MKDLHCLEGEIICELSGHFDRLKSQKSKYVVLTVLLCCYITIAFVWITFPVGIIQEVIISALQVRYFTS